MAHRFTRTLRLLAGALGLLLVGLTASGASYVPNTQIPPGFAGSHVVVDGLPLRVVQHGHGPDVLFIHGSSGSVEDWEPLMRALGDGVHVTAYDRPGHGYSGDAGDYSLAYNAKVARAVIDTLHLQHVVVVGHSYGGSTALALALLAPQRVKAYVIVDSSVYAPSAPAKAIFHLLHVPWLGVGFVRVLGGSTARAKIRAGVLEQFRGAAPPPGFVELRERIWSSPKVSHALAEEWLGMRTFLARQSPRYPQIHAPVRIVAEADSAFRREAAEHLHRDVAGSTLRLLPGAGHYLQIEKTADVADEVRAALALP